MHFRSIKIINKQIHKYLFLIFPIFFIGCGGDGYFDITRLSNSIDGMYANDIKIENNLIDLSNQDNFTIKGTTTYVEDGNNVSISIKAKDQNLDDSKNSTHTTYAIVKDNKWKTPSINFTTFHDASYDVIVEVQDNSGNEAAKQYMIFSKDIDTTININQTNLNRLFSRNDTASSTKLYVNSYDIRYLNNQTLFGTYKNRNSNIIKLIIDNNKAEITNLYNKDDSDSSNYGNWNITIDLDNNLTQGLNDIKVFISKQETGFKANITIIKDTISPELNTTTISYSNTNGTNDSTLDFNFTEIVKFESDNTLRDTNTSNIIYGNITIVAEVTNSTLVSDGNRGNYTVAHIQINSSNFETYFGSNGNYNNNMQLQLKQSFIYGMKHRVIITRGVFQDLAQNDFNGTGNLSTTTYIFNENTNINSADSCECDNYDGTNKTLDSCFIWDLRVYD